MDSYDIYKFFGFEPSRSIESSETIDEFNEEDIWGCALDAQTKWEAFQENRCNGLEENIVGKVGTRKIPKSHEENNKRRKKCSSAAVNIPYYCEMIWEERKEIGNFWKEKHGMILDNGNSSDDDNGDFGTNMIPPHELIAIQHRRNDMTSLSEFEDLGKTLKGRDVIWTVTGLIA